MLTGAPQALGAMVCYGCADLLYKQAARRGIRPQEFLMAQAWFFTPLVWSYGLFTGTLHYRHAVLWGAGAGLCLYAALYNFSYSLRDGLVSLYAPIFRLSFVLTAALAVALLGEPVTPSKLGGLAAALAAVWLLLGEGAPRPGAPRANLGRVVFASCALGFTNFTYKLGVAGGAEPASLLAAQASVFIVVSTWVGLRRERSWARTRPALPFGAAAAVLLASGFLALLQGLRRGEASVLVPVSQMSFVIASMLGMLFLREGVSARKLTGLLAAVAALAGLAAGSL